MTPGRNKDELKTFVDAGLAVANQSGTEAFLLLVEHAIDFAHLKTLVSGIVLIVASQDDEVTEQARAAGINTVLLDVPEATLHDQLTQAILEAVAAEWLQTGAAVVALYSGFDGHELDSISVIRLTERLGKLTARDLKQLGINVPLDTLKLVVDLAVDIGREGREGKPVGTMFVVGDHRRVMEESRPSGFDFVKGYPRKERNLADPRVREGIKEIAQLDGMFVVAADGTVEASCRLVDTSPVELTMTTGLGARHFAGAAISKTTKAIGIVVSETSGTVRLFQNGEVVLRIEPFRRAMKWKSFHAESNARDEV